MRFSNKLLVLTSVLTLMGCAPQAELKPAPPETTKTTVSYVPGEFNEESIFELLTAELAGQQRDFDKAQQLIERQAELNQSSALAERATRLAQFLRDSGRVQHSAELWQKLSPEDEAPAQILLNTLFHEDRVNDALDLIEAREDFSTETLVLIDTHLARLNNDQAKRLLKILDKQQAVKTKRLDLILVIAKTEIHIGHIDRAMNLLNAGLKIEPTQADLVIEKAQILVSRTEFSNALKLVNQALKENPTNRQLRALQVQQLLKLAPRKVKSAVNKAIDQANRDPQIIYYYALLMMENDQLIFSEELFSDLLTADPKATDLYLYLGIIAANQNKKEQAIDAFSKVERGKSLLNASSRALQLMDANTESDRALAFINGAIINDPEQEEDLNILYTQWLQRSGDTDAAVSYISAQINKEPESAHYLYARAMLQDDFDHQAMLQDLESAYQADSTNPTIQNALGYTLLEYTDQYQRAYELISLAYKQSPTEVAIIDSMGWALHKLGRNAEALPYLEKAYMEFSDAEVGSHLIIVLSILGQQERANQIYQDLFEKNPDSKDLKEALEWLNN